jgi:hypothetical protein
MSAIKGETLVIVTLKGELFEKWNPHEVRKTVVCLNNSLRPYF